MSFHSFLIQQGLDSKPQGGESTTQQPSSPQGGGASASPFGSNGLMMLLPILLVGFLFFSQSRQKKQEEKQRASLKRGDRVVTTSGIVGELVEFDEKFAKVQIAPGVKIQMLIAAVSPMVEKTAEVAKTDVKTEPVVEKK